LALEDAAPEAELVASDVLAFVDGIDAAPRPLNRE
jgi:hypothetical protein